VVTAHAVGVDTRALDGDAHGRLAEGAEVFLEGAGGLGRALTADVRDRRVRLEDRLEHGRHDHVAHHLVTVRLRVGVRVRVRVRVRDRVGIRVRAS
jgi:hypothetical protein